MPSSPVILEYEPPPLRLTARVGRLIATVARAVWRRKPWPAELLLLAWLTLCVANVVQAVKCWASPFAYFTPPIYVWRWLAYLFAVVLGGVWGLARQDRWRAMVICGGIVLVTGVASGTLQWRPGEFVLASEWSAAKSHDVAGTVVRAWVRDAGGIRSIGRSEF